MTYQIIDAKKAEHKILVSCKLMGVSPSGYFAWKKRGCERRRLCRDRVALAHVRERFFRAGKPMAHRASGMTFKKMASASAATASPA